MPAEPRQTLPNPTAIVKDLQHPNVIDAAAAFAKRLHKSPTDRVILTYPEWTDLVEAIRSLTSPRSGG